MTTPVLTRLLLEAVQFQSPKRSGMYRPKLRYAHQGGMNPPVIVIHGNSLEHVTDTYKRYLENWFREGGAYARFAAAAVYERAPSGELLWGGGA